MNFTELQSRVAEETGLDLTNTDDSASIQAWINKTYLHVSGLQNWDWLFKQGVVNTEPDITSITATITGYSHTVTLSAAPTTHGFSVSLVGLWAIKFTSVSADWYFFNSHTAGSTTAGLETAFNSSTTLTAGACILRKVYYTLPSDCNKIIDIKQHASSVKLTYVDPRYFDSVLPNPTATGNPRFYSLLGRYSVANVSTTNLWKIGLYPFPSSSINLQVSYYQEVPELAGSIAVPLMPLPFHDVLIYGALYFYGHPFIDDDRMVAAKARYDRTIKDMRANSKHVPDGLTRLRPSDMSNRSTLRRYTLPDEYGI